MGTPLFNPNDGLTGRDGGPYLDEVQAQQDEIKRAKVEGREPDLDNPGANAGIQLSTAQQMLHTLTVANNPSMDHKLTSAVDKVWKDAFDADAEDKANLQITDEIPDTSKQPSNDDLNDKEQVFNVNDPNAPLTESEGQKGKDGQPDQPSVKLVGDDPFASSDDDKDKGKSSSSSSSSSDKGSTTDKSTSAKTATGSTAKSTSSASTTSKK